MKIMFIGTSGVHHPLLAAYSFLNIAVQDLNDMPVFGNARLDAAGSPLYIGEDSRGNQVYTLGMGKEVLLGKKAIEDLVKILGFSSRDLIVEPVSVLGETWLPSLNKISLFLGGNFILRRLSYRFLRMQHRHIFRQVNEISKKIAAD
ncbi:DUF3189 family protein [Syntrophomonas palmitatica]|uniref:DUF3189 family protein n=1 Tax=Syntrophomonas palmitatica TaxID=402877 RepID=UPI0006D1CA0A|nr:DUF3189 family protein [Syntrophomonas palmitatica]